VNAAARRETCEGEPAGRIEASSRLRKSSPVVARHAFARGASIAARRSMIVMATLVSISASPAAIAAC